MRITEKTPAGAIYQKAYQLYKLRLLAILFLIPLYILTCKWGNFSIENLGPLSLVIAIEIFVNRPYKAFFRDTRSGAEALIASVVIEQLTYRFWAAIEGCRTLTTILSQAEGKETRPAPDASVTVAPPVSSWSQRVRTMLIEVPATPSPVSSQTTRIFRRLWSPSEVRSPSGFLLLLKA